jgi:enamine deaminase RidA (YjgF/YER057c/UK114 family)
VQLGSRCIVMEHALLRGRRDHPAVLMDDVLVGPHAHVNGAVVEGGCFIATGAAIFPGARLEAGAEVRIHGVVHVNTRVLAGDTVPIGWVAVGDPAQIMPPDHHEDIWRIQRELDFPGTVYGVPRGTPPAVRMRRQVEWYGAHRGDRIVEGSRGPSPGWTGGAVPERVSRRGSGAPWEAVAGYSRAVRAGPLLLVAGTTATGPDGDVGPEGDLHGQTLRALENVREAVERAGARLDQVVGTRMFVTDIRRWEDAARARRGLRRDPPGHGDGGGVRPDRPQDARGGRGDRLARLLGRRGGGRARIASAPRASSSSGRAPDF